MSREIEVHIDHAGSTHLVGRLYVASMRGTESASFSYDQAWLMRPDAFALEPGLPLAAGVFVSGGGSGGPPLPSSVRDGAPDRWGISLIQRMARKDGSQPRTLGQLDYLLALDDFTRIGALRYKEKGEGAPFLNVTDSRTVPPLINLPMLLQAADAVNRDTETAEDLRFLLGYGSPLGGARPKSAVIDNDGQLLIAKFPKPDDTRNLAVGEVLALALAKQAGIDSAVARMIRVEGNAVSLIRRFDREADGSRRHFISALTMLQAHEGSEETYTAIAEQIRMHGSEPQLDLRDLWSRIVLTVLVSNRDDHLRNHGFLYDADGRWRLSPAYDINPVPIYEKGAYLETWINESGNEATLERAMESHKDFMLSLDQAKEIVGRVASVCENWRQVARTLGARDAEIAPYETAFEHEELKLAKTMVASQHSVTSLVKEPSDGYVSAPGPEPS